MRASTTRGKLVALIVTSNFSASIPVPAADATDEAEHGAFGKQLADQSPATDTKSDSHGQSRALFRPHGPEAGLQHWRRLSAGRVRPHP
jgi:hypothetical protein